MNKIKAIHGVRGADGGFEGFTEGDHLRVQLAVVEALKEHGYTHRPWHDDFKPAIEKITQQVVKEICADDLKIHWNTWSKDRVSFSLYPASTTYDPRFAPGCTITLA